MARRARGAKSGGAGTGAELLVACLAAGGIDTVYALPGEETNALMDALAASEIEVVLCRHEQGAAFMASVHGRLTGRPAACLSTLGPGATNLVTGVADAELDCVPLVAITGQAGRTRLPRGSDSHQVIDLTRLFEPVTKHSQTLWSAADIPGSVAEALSVATAARPGAVHLSLPEDVAAETVDAAPLSVPDSAPPLAGPQALGGAVELIGGAERPVLLVGAGALRRDATGDLAGFLEAAPMPCTTSFMAKGAVPFDAPGFLGPFGLPRVDHVDRAIASADLLIAVGLDPVEYPVEKLGHDGVPFLSVHEDRLPRNLGVTLSGEVVGDIGASLRALSASARRQSPPDIWDAARVAQLRYLEDLERGVKEADLEPPTPGALVAALNAALSAEDTVISGVGTHKLALAREFMAKRPGQLIVANGLAGMGIALPGALAAARLQERGRAIAVCGDGDILMNVQEMETARRLDLAVTVIVWEDGGLGLIEDKQEQDTGTRPDLSFGPVDWASLARAFGWSHTACATAGGLAEVLKEVLKANGDPAEPRQRLITVPVAYAGNYA